MNTESIEVKNKTGLHARPAAVFVQTASKFKANITIEKDGRQVNAKSILALLSIGASLGSMVTITAEGEDENQAVAELIALIQSKFGEE